MANVKYKDQEWAVGTPIAGEQLSANGVYTGQQGPTPMQGHGETTADPYHVAHGIIRQGTIMQDSGDEHFPEKCFSIVYNLNGGSGTIPDTQTQDFDGGALTIAGFPATAVVAKFDEDVAETPASTSLKVIANTATPVDGEIRLKDVVPTKYPQSWGFCQESCLFFFQKTNGPLIITGASVLWLLRLQPTIVLKRVCLLMWPQWITVLKFPC